MSSPNLETAATIQARTSLPGIHCLRRSVSALVCRRPRVFEKTPENGENCFVMRGEIPATGCFKRYANSRVFQGFWDNRMIQKRKSSLSSSGWIKMLETLPSQHHYVAGAKLTWLGGVSGKALNKHLTSLSTNAYVCTLITPWLWIKSHTVLNAIHYIDL